MKFLFCEHEALTAPYFHHATGIGRGDTGPGPGDTVCFSGGEHMHQTIGGRLLAGAFLTLFSAAVPVGTSHAATGNFQQCGKASWYKLGGTTASGEKADPGGMTAAHRTLPFGSLVTVTNLANGKSVKLRINDRGPYSKGRVIDVTLAAARELGFVNKGVTRVRVSGDVTGAKKVKSTKCP